MKENEQKCRRKGNIFSIHKFLYSMHTSLCCIVNIRGAISHDLSSGNSDPVSHSCIRKCASAFPGTQEEHPIDTEKQTWKYLNTMSSFMNL